MSVLDLAAVDRTQIALVGGKGANLGELSRIPDVRVPPGFCVTTQAFGRVMASAALEHRLEKLSRLRADDHAAIRAASDEIRGSIEAIAIPADLTADVARAIAAIDEHGAFAVRSSATAEDLPSASFAGQQDSYLNISGTANLVRHVSRCWASLFTERAVTYRLRNRIDHRKVQMAVVVQRMVDARASGVMFTADPVTGSRTVTSIEATFGLGEALVSGLVNADAYQVDNGDVVARTVRQERPVLSDAEITRLTRLGRTIEAHFGRPQDIEWCLAADDFQFVQSRPITTLFPIPVAADREKHVYLSVGHQQMMTDAMKPLGISVWQMIAAAPMHEAGGRLFVDVARTLASPAARAGLLALIAKSDELFADALRTVAAREFIPMVPDAAPPQAPPPATAPPLPNDSAIVAELIARGQESIAKLKHEIAEKSGDALFDFIVADAQELKRIAFDRRNMQAIMAGMEATWWLNERLSEWIGEKNAADVLTQSVPNNVTSEMGLELMHVADVIRPHAAVVGLLERAERESRVAFMDELGAIDGGREARQAIRAWLDKYGMRCLGEIDITRPRWSERPLMLVPMILGNVRNFGPRAGRERFEEGRRAAAGWEKELLARVRELPDGERKASETKEMIERLRTFSGYREYPKYFIINRLFAYKLALLREAERLVQSGALRERDDIFFLGFEELRHAVRSGVVDEQLVRDRRETFRANQALTPPRVLTSDGEMFFGRYRRDDVPAGALVGLAVSAGTVEGRARVIFDPSQATMEPGDILVTPFTDPSWTPVFVGVRALVTEIGGLMTHGAVIAREYGLPAVVGVVDATRLIRDGQRIRVHGTEGYVEILSESEAS
ncbi:MAG TPA: phosphoenolpyruvate synthase [Gemmatimonadaceae bacterium]|nr:phosphoenolpyruvate synthase [Gemmatimonadaceae bacterium]